MSTTAILVLAALILAAALLYSSVGHGGASGYLAAMALFGVAPAVMKPTALALNILVATIATVKYLRAGCFSARLFWAFACTSIPLAFVGGRIELPAVYYKPVVGVVLLYAAVQLWRGGFMPRDPAARPSPIVAAGLGAVVGLLSGLTGVGGGIFLTPLVLFMGWSDVRQAAGVSAAFILVNSVAGLAGLWSRVGELPEALPLWATAAVVGGWVGAEYGSRRLAGPTMQRLLAAVLTIGGAKLVLGG